MFTTAIVPKPLIGSARIPAEIRYTVVTRRFSPSENRLGPLPHSVRPCYTFVFEPQTVNLFCLYVWKGQVTNSMLILVCCMCILASYVVIHYPVSRESHLTLERCVRCRGGWSRSREMFMTWICVDSLCTLAIRKLQTLFSPSVLLVAASFRDHSWALVELIPKKSTTPFNPWVPDVVEEAEPKWQTALPEEHRNILEERLLGKLPVNQGRKLP